MDDRDPATGRFLPDHSIPGPGVDGAYDPAMNDQAFKLALLGLTDDEIGKFFGVTERTINRWKNDFPAFCQSLNAGKVQADAEVAHSLYKRATGEFTTAERAFRDGDKWEVVTLKTWLPGDPGAAKLWLTNRQGAKWREKQTVEHEGKLTVTLESDAERL